MTTSVVCRQKRATEVAPTNLHLVVMNGYPQMVLAVIGPVAPSTPNAVGLLPLNVTLSRYAYPIAKEAADYGHCQLLIENAGQKLRKTPANVAKPAVLPPVLEGGLEGQTGCNKGGDDAGHIGHLVSAVHRSSCSPFHK